MVWPLEATGMQRFAEGLDEILVVEEKRQVLEYQLKEELFSWIGSGQEDPARGGQVRRQGRRRMGGAAGQLAAAGALRVFAGHRRQGHRRAPAEVRTAAPTSAPASRRALPSSTRASARCRGRVVARTQAVVLFRLSAQYVHACARRFARHGGHRLPLHGALDGSQHGRIHPHGRRGRTLGGAGAVHRREARLRQPGRRHVLPFGAAGHPRRGGRQGIHHLQDPVQRRRRDDRRPAGGRAHHACP